MGMRCFLPSSVDAATLLALVPECTLHYGGPLVVPMAIVVLVFFLLVARNRNHDAGKAPQPLAKRDGIQRK